MNYLTYHVCHAHLCETQVPPKMFMCKKHWYRLRAPLRDAVWKEYQPGQEISKNPSLRYLAVQKLAVAESAFKPNDEKAAWDSALYLAEAMEYQKRCIALGLGDPLEGLIKAEILQK